MGTVPTDTTTILLQLVGAFGPVGAFAMVLLLGGAYFYRRDLLKRTGVHKEHEQQLAVVVQQNTAAFTDGAVVQERFSQTLGQLSASIQRSEESRAREFAVMLEAVRRRDG